MAKPSIRVCQGTTEVTVHFHNTKTEVQVTDILSSHRPSVFTDMSLIVAALRRAGYMVHPPVIPTNAQTILPNEESE